MLIKIQEVLCEKNIKFKTSILRPNLRDYSDTYVVVKGTIAVEGDDDNKKKR